MSKNNVQDPVDEEDEELDSTQPLDDMKPPQDPEPRPKEETKQEKKKRLKEEAKQKKKKEEAASKNKGKSKLPSYFTDKVLSSPKFQRQEALNWLLGLDNDKFISRSAKITYCGPRKSYAPREKVLIAKRSGNAKNNNWHLFHTGKPFFRGDQSKLKVKDPDFIRMALRTPTLFKVVFVKEKPLEAKEAKEIYQAPRESQLNMTYRAKLGRLRAGNKTAVTLDEAQRALKDIAKLGPFKKGMNLNHILTFLQTIISEDNTKKKTNSK